MAQHIARTAGCRGADWTGEFIYNRDINDPFYLNANLPAAESAFTGVDNRPRWVATSAFPTCAPAGQIGPCFTRLNNSVGNQVTQAYVIKNTSKNRSWNVAASLAKPMTAGVSFKGAYSYGVHAASSNRVPLPALRSPPIRSRSIRTTLRSRTR